LINGPIGVGDPCPEQRKECPMGGTQQGREFLRADIWEDWPDLETDQRRGVLSPPIQKPYPEDAQLTDLVAPEALTVGSASLAHVIGRRRSRRRFSEEHLSLEEISFLLWATQGVSEVWREGAATRRTVPSAGSRHPFVTYLLARRVEGVIPGLHTYLPLNHQLCFLRPLATLEDTAEDPWGSRPFLMDSAVVFIWTVIPYRTEWRYGVISPKLIALDAGHVCQNLYLASEALGAGTCAVGTYNQRKLDALVGVDGSQEFTVYLAPVGKIDQECGLEPAP
jgi:SagB-type dehydrogenase family enzyme